VRIAARAGAPASTTFWAMAVLPTVSHDNPPSAPSAGLAASEPPSPVVRKADTSSAQKPPGLSGNRGNTPPTSTSDP
jgi:hypothetical protein